MDYEKEILKITNKKILKSDLKKWLNKNFGEFIISEKSKSCLENKFPCFCIERKSECLFIEVYSKLNEIAKYFELNAILENQLTKYESIINNEAEIKNWLIENLKIGLNELWFFMSPNYPNIKVSFINGKRNDNFEYLKIEIEGNEFKPIYDFANLFSNLFFEEKILPNEYAKWKYENEITE